MNEDEYIKKIELILSLEDSKFENEVMSLLKVIMKNGLNLSNEEFEEIINEMAYDLDFYDSNAKGGSTLYGNQKIRIILSEYLMRLKDLIIE